MQPFTNSSFATLALLLSALAAAEAMPVQDAKNVQPTCLPLGNSCTDLIYPCCGVRVLCKKRVGEIRGICTSF